MSRAASISTTTRALRAQLREILAAAAKGKEVTVTLRGKPYVRIVAVEGGATDDGAPEPRKAEGRKAAAKKPAKASKKK